MDKYYKNPMLYNNYWNWDCIIRPGLPVVMGESKTRRIAHFDNLENYIIVPGKNRPDILVSVNRYLYNKPWDNACRSVNDVGGFMLPLPYAVDFFRLLMSGDNIFYGNGKKVLGCHRAIFDSGYPFRAEWLDASFKLNPLTKDWSIVYHKIESDGSLKEVTEPLQECLRDGKNPRIDLVYWLNNSTSQGLPPKNNPKGMLFYVPPRDGAVAWFGAGSGGVFLGCNGGPQGSDAGLGVRVAKIRK